LFWSSFLSMFLNVICLSLAVAVVKTAGISSTQLLLEVTQFGQKFSSIFGQSE
jgi:hypothetical protein